MAKKKIIEPMNVTPLIKLISKEKDLEPEVIKNAVESAIMSAALKRSKVFKDARADLDLTTGNLHILVTKKVVVHVEDDKHEIDILSAKAMSPKFMLGQEIPVEISPEEFGRIAAQSVRQGILQRLRDAERDNVYEEYKNKVGQVVTIITQRYDRADCLVALGKIECVIPRQEIPQGARYKGNERVRALIIKVERRAKGPQIFL